MSKYNTLDSLIGQAAIFRVKGRNDEAIELLKEVIRQEPKKPEPYLHLSEMLEDINFSSSLEYRVLYCNMLTKGSSHDWEYAGDMALRLKRHKQASDYFGKAITLDKTNWLLYEKRIKSLEEIGLKGDAMKTRLLAAMSVDYIQYNLSFESLNSMIKEVAEYYVNTNSDSELILVLKASVKRLIQFKMDYKEQFETLINVLKTKEAYETIIEVILGFRIGIVGLGDDEKPVYSFSDDCKLIDFPSHKLTHFEFNSEISTVNICILIISFLKSGFYDYAKLVLPEIFNRGIKQRYFDIYLELLSVYSTSADTITGIDVAKKFTALPVFECTADVYFYYGLMLEKQEKYDEAIQYYKTTLTYDNGYVDAKINLSCILQDRDDTEAALEILKDTDIDEGHRLPDEKLLLRQLELLRLPDDRTQLIRTKRMLLAPYFYEIIRDEQAVYTGRRKESQMKVVLKRLAMKIVSKTPMEKLVLRMGQISVKDGRKLLLSGEELQSHCLNLIWELHYSNRSQEMLYISCLASIHPKICNQQISDILFYAASRSKNYKLCLEYIRERIHRFKDKQLNLLPKLYIAMNYFLCHEPSEVYIKFFSRLLDKYPEDERLLVVAGNNAYITGCYKSSLLRYVLADKICSNNSLIWLMSSLSLISLGCKRDITNRKSILTRAINVLGQYRNLRKEKGPIQEIYYNIGRAFHQIGQLNHAVIWYEKVLNESDILANDRDDNTIDPKINGLKYDLKPLAAYNIICIIFTQNPSKARKLRSKYCVLG